jgi:hypothetical protein
MANDVNVPLDFTYSKTAAGREKQLASLNATLENKDLNFTQKALLKKRVKQLNQMNKGQALYEETKNAEKEKVEQKQVKKRDEDKVTQSKVSEEERKAREARVNRYNETVQRGKKKVNNPYALSNFTTAKERKDAIENAGYDLTTPRKPKTPNTPTKPKTPKTPTKTPTKTKPKTGRSGMGNEDYQGGMSVQSKAKYAKDKKDRLAREAKDKANAAKNKTTKKTAPKKKAGESGMGMNSYQNLNFQRRK